jgi:hypothetical protein
MYLAMVSSNRIGGDGGGAGDDDNDEKADDKTQQRHQQQLCMKNAMFNTLIVYFYMSVLIAPFVY